MTIDADYQHTPLQPVVRNVPVVDPETGLLTDAGALLLQSLRNHIVGGNRIIPCTATGKNVITLTPNDSSPLLEKYVDHDIFAAIAAQTSDGSVTGTVVPATGSLATIKVYVSDGASQAGAGDIVAGSFYLFAFVDTLDSGSGGLVVK